MHRSLVVFALALGMAQAAGAATITASASVGPAASPVTDVDGPAISGQVLAGVVVPLAFRNLEAHSALDVDGNSAVSLTGVYLSAGKPHVAGIDYPQLTDAVTTWTTTVTNNTGSSHPYFYSFLLHPFTLENYDNGIGNTDPLATETSFAVEVRANGNTVFQAGALLRGALTSYELTKTGTDLGGVFANNEFAIRYDFAQHQARIALGNAAPGESITIETKLIAHTKATQDGSGGNVTMGDPLDLKGDPGISSVIFGIDDSVGAAPLSWSATKSLYR